MAVSFASAGSRATGGGLCITVLGLRRRTGRRWIRFHPRRGGWLHLLSFQHRRQRHWVWFSSSLRKGGISCASLGCAPLSASLLWSPTLDCGSACRRRCRRWWTASLGAGLAVLAPGPSASDRQLLGWRWRIGCRSSLAAEMTDVLGRPFTRLHRLAVSPPQRSPPCGLRRW